MKKKIILSIVALFSVVAIVLASVPYRCGFTGQEPPHSVSHGGEYTLHYYSYARSSEGRSDGMHIYLTGDAWVIYYSVQAAQQYHFHSTNGSVQCCYDY